MKFMKINKKEQRKKRIAAIVAIILVVAMVFSLIAPIFSARAMAAQTVNTTVVTEQQTNGAALTEKQKKDREVGVDNFSATVFIGFEQQYIVGNTVPVSAIMVNNGEDFNGEFQIKVYSYIGSENEGGKYAIYYQPLELSRGAGKQVNLTIPMDTIQKDFEISLVDSKNNVVYRKYFDAKALDPATMLVGVVCERPTDMAYFSAIHFAEEQDYTGDYTKTVYLNSETFPTQEAVMNHFKVIVIDDFDTKTLSQQQKEALLQWIETGGVCVLGTGVNAVKTLSGLQDIIAVESNDNTTQKNITIAEQRVRADVAELNLTNIENVENNTFENAFIIHIDNGAVILYDISLSLAPATETAGFVNEIKDCCEYANESLKEINYSDSYRYNPITYIAQRFPELKANSIYMILFIVVIYVVIVGPVLYFILKKKDKREWGWIAVPTLSIIFVAIVFVLSINSQYKSGLINIVSATRVKDGQSIGTTDIYGCAKHSKKGEVVLTTEEFVNLSVPSDERWNYYEVVNNDTCTNKILVGDSTEITYFDKGSWDNNDFEMETITDLGGIVDCDVKMEGDKLVGTITNHTNRNFKDVLLIVGKRVIMIENLKAEESIDINEDIIDKQITDLSNAIWEVFRDLYDRTEMQKKIKAGEMTRQDAYRMMRESDLVQDYINWNETEMRLLNEGDIKVFLYAFDEDSILPQTFYLNGQTAIENALNLYMMEYAVHLSEAGSFEIPFGILSGTIMGQEDNQFIRDYRDGTVYAEMSTEIEWAFGIPANTEIQSVQFRSLNDSGNFYQAPEIYNVSAGQWELLQSEEYYDMTDYIGNVSEDYPNGCIIVKYFVQKETEIRYPEIKLKGAGQNVGN